METETLQPPETKLEEQQPEQSQQTTANDNEQPFSQSEIEQIQEAQDINQGQIDALQALIATVDTPEARDEYSALISQLKSNNGVLATAVANPIPENRKKARGVLKGANNAAAMELGYLGDDIKPKEEIDCAKPPINQLSDAATQILQNVQNNMQGNIQSDDFLKKHAESIVFNSGTIKSNDELMENLIFINAIKSLPTEQKNTLESMTINMKDGFSLNNIKKINNNFASEGLISVPSLNEACHAEKCHHSNDNSYTKQIIAVNSIASAMQLGQILTHEYMEQALQQQKQNGVSFTPETKIMEPKHQTHNCGRVAAAALDTHQEMQHN
jgi:hypothetical protein